MTSDSIQPPPARGLAQRFAHPEEAGAASALALVQTRAFRLFAGRQRVYEHGSPVKLPKGIRDEDTSLIPTGFEAVAALGRAPAPEFPVRSARILLHGRRGEEGYLLALARCDLECRGNPLSRTEEMRRQSEGLS